jgi:hypothetical protein
MPKFGREDIQAFSEIIEDCYRIADDPTKHPEQRQSAQNWAARRSEQLWDDQLDRS